MKEASGLIACEECDAVYRRVTLEQGEVANCSRCGANLYSYRILSIMHVLPLTLASVIIFVIANVFPIVDLDFQGIRNQTTLYGAVQVLCDHDMFVIAFLVFLTTLLFPFLQLSALFYILIPLSKGVRPPGFRILLRILHALYPWGMIEVFLLGIIVALIKLSHSAVVIPDTALWAFSVLTLLMIVINAIPPRYYWYIGKPASEGISLIKKRLEGKRAGTSGSYIKPKMSTAASMGMMSCLCCGTLWRNVPDCGACCQRCGARLHQRKMNSIKRTWAFLMAAWVLYLPANILPVMVTASFTDKQKDTILSGIMYFWASGSWGLAIIVFTASFLVPMLKLVVLMFLTICAQRHSEWGRIRRARLYRLLEVIGRWSMLDVFVVALLTGLVQIRFMATITPGLGMIAFGLMVVMTMLASLSFDPRLTWDNAEGFRGHLNPRVGSGEKEVSAMEALQLGHSYESFDSFEL